MMQRYRVQKNYNKCKREVRREADANYIKACRLSGVTAKQIRPLIHQECMSSSSPRRNPSEGIPLVSIAYKVKQRYVETG